MKIKLLKAKQTGTNLITNSSSTIVSLGFLPDEKVIYLGRGGLEEAIRLGRRMGETVNKDNYLQIVSGYTDIERSVSRLHAKIEKGDNGYIIFDLNSTNGIKIQNKENDSVKVLNAKLNDGDVIYLGHQEYLVSF